MRHGLYGSARLLPVVLPDPAPEYDLASLPYPKAEELHAPHVLSLLTHPVGHFNPGPAGPVGVAMVVSM